MIHISNPESCCGCSACAQICHKQCISMKEDEEGFLYPIVNETLCVNCGLCENVCPLLVTRQKRHPIKVYASKNVNETIRLQSSSGGIFSILAEEVLDKGGVVFGVKFNVHGEVVHDYTETKEGLSDFRGSKYVQSRMGSNYQKAEQFLKQGREVLFSGTPCQVAGLKCFLGKEYKSLLTVDFICHGVPSPKVWRMYLNETIVRLYKDKSTFSKVKSSLSMQNAYIENISFRDKRLGWENFSFVLNTSIVCKNGIKKTISLCESKYKNLFLKGFLHNVCLRQSCHHCAFKNFASGSDITLSDFWSINRYMSIYNDHKGYSLLYIFSDTLMKDIGECIELDVDNIVSFHSAIRKSSKAHKNRDIFFTKLSSSNGDIYKLLKKYSTITMKKRIKLFIVNLLRYR